MMKRALLKIVLLVVAVAAAGCTIKYSFGGTNYSADAKTFSVAYFPNNAQMVAPILSQTLTDALTERMESQTKLSQVNPNDDADIKFEGEITGYDSRPTSVSAESQTATYNKLTITVRVQFTSRYDPQFNYSKSFSASQDYPTSSLLQSVEGTLIPEIVDDLVNQIFSAAMANW